MSMILWIGLCILVGFFASHRGRSAIGWGIFAIVISPVLAAIILAIMKDLRVEKDMRRNRMESDRLQERMAVSESQMHDRMDHMENRINHMEQPFSGTLEDNRVRKNLPPVGGETKYCHNCGTPVTREAKFCPSCGASLER